MSQIVEVTLGGQEVSVTIDGGNIGAGASVLLADLNQAVADAEQAASDAAESAAEAGTAGAEAGAIAGASAGATAGADAGTASGAIAGGEAANAVVAGKADTDGGNLTDPNATDFRNAIRVTPYVTADQYGGDADAAAAAGFAAGIPLYYDNPLLPARLTINPTAEAANTNAARGAYFKAACEWAAKAVLKNGANLDVFLTGGKHVMEGQVTLDDFDRFSESSALSLRSDTATARGLVGQTITYGSRVSRVTHVSVTNGGTGFATAPTVVFTGGGGTGAAATAYVDGGVITGVVVTNGGSGYTSSPSVSFTGGGGTGAAASSAFNANIYPVTVVSQTALPANIAVGMLVIIRDVVGTNDCRDVNGGHMVSAFNTGTREVSFEITVPGTDPISGVASAGTIRFPVSWIAVQGGYTGLLSGQEGFLNANNGHQIRVRDGFFTWEDGPNQAIKGNQCCLHVGTGLGRIQVYTHSAIVGFPGRAVRVNTGTYYLNQLAAGGGIMGQSGVIHQGGGFGQIVQSVFSSFKDEVLLVGRGCFSAISSSKLATGTHSIRNEGGTVDFQTSELNHGVTGSYVNLGGLTYGGASGTITRAGVGISWDSGGAHYGDGAITGSTTSDTIDSIPKGTMTRGGGYFSTSTSPHLTTLFELAVGSINATGNLTVSNAVPQVLLVDGSTTAIVNGDAGNLRLSAHSSSRDIFFGHATTTQATWKTSNSTFLIGANQVLKAREAAVTKPTGGATIDAECRTALNSLIDKLGTLGHGLIANT